jgi:hypothetical protein
MIYQSQDPSYDASAVSIAPPIPFLIAMSTSFLARLEWLLILSYLVVLSTLVVGAVRSRGRPQLLFGGWFAMALVPFLVCALLALLRLRKLQLEGPVKEVNRSIHELLDPLALGLGTSILFLVIHLIPHLKRWLHRVLCDRTSPSESVRY